MTPTEGQHPLPGSGPEEADPTGIRELLRTLPDPGPMPDDLVERISARLSVEQAQRLQDRGSTTGHARAGLVDLAEHRSRRRPGRTLAYLGVAAAGLLVATVAVGELVGGGLLGGTTAGLDSAAHVSTQSRAADAGGADAAGGAEETGDESVGGALEGAGSAADSAGGDAAEQPEAAAADLPVEVLPPLGEITAGAERSDVLAALTRDTVSSASGQGTLSVAGAERCWAAGGDGAAWPQRQAAEAVYEREPVVVLVGRDGEAGSAVLLPASCTDGASVDALAALAWGP